jgi:hypothetical protein
MTITLKIDLNENYQLCKQLWGNVFLPCGFEIHDWIENKKTRQHIELDDLIKNLGDDEIETRKKINYCAKSLKANLALFKINNINQKQG